MHFTVAKSLTYILLLLKHNNSLARMEASYPQRVGENRNVNTIEERRLKNNNRNRVFYCHLSPATNGNQKHCFYRILIRVPRLLITFLIEKLFLSVF